MSQTTPESELLIEPQGIEIPSLFGSLLLFSGLLIEPQGIEMVKEK